MIRRLNTAVIAIAILLGSSTLSLADTGGAKGGQKIKAALAQLDLSASQKQQIKKIITDAKSASNGGAKAEGGGKEIMKKIIAVLTPEQKLKLKEILKASRTAKT